MKKLTGPEREALERFARGATVGDIAYATAQKMSVVQTMLTDLCDLDRIRAAQIVDHGLGGSAPRPAFVEPAAINPPGAPELDLSTWELVLAAGESHGSKTIQGLTQRVKVLLLDLYDRLEADHRERAEAEAAEAARVAAAQRVARLEAELAAAREEARTVGVGRAARDYDPQQVRAWAREQRPPVPCPAHGRVPKTVLARWREANP